MTFSGERIQAVARTPPQDITFVERTRTVIIQVSPARSKTATGHPTAMPRELAERLLQRATENRYSVIDKHDDKNDKHDESRPLAEGPID
jgi:hypothetical protein